MTGPLLMLLGAIVLVQTWRVDRWRRRAYAAERKRLALARWSMHQADVIGAGIAECRRLLAESTETSE